MHVKKYRPVSKEEEEYLSEVCFHSGHLSQICRKSNFGSVFAISYKINDKLTCGANEVVCYSKSQVRNLSQKYVTE